MMYSKSMVPLFAAIATVKLQSPEVLNTVTFSSDSDPDLFDPRIVSATLVRITKPDTMDRFTFVFRELVFDHPREFVARVKVKSNQSYALIKKIAAAVGLDPSMIRKYKVPDLLNKPLRVILNDRGYVIDVRTKHEAEVIP